MKLFPSQGWKMNQMKPLLILFYACDYATCRRMDSAVDEKILRHRKLGQS
jgi:hypothetical protein